MPKAIIFDWGRTLYDVEGGREFAEAESVLQHCRDRGYRVGSVSLVSGANTIEDRTDMIQNSPLRKYLDMYFVTDKDKDDLFDQMIGMWDLPRPEVLIVDDRTVRGVKYGNDHGHPTVWIKKGKFAGETPDAATGDPTHTIGDLKDLLEII